MRPPRGVTFGAARFHPPGDSMAGATIDEQLANLRRRRTTPAPHERAASLRADSQRIIERSDVLLSRSRRLRLESAWLRVVTGAAPGGAAPAAEAPGPPSLVDAAPGACGGSGAILGFRLRGVIDGEPVVADWTPHGPIA